MFCQDLLSPKVKQSVIISNKHGIYKVPHILPNYLRLRILEKWEISGKSQKSLQ